MKTVVQNEKYGEFVVDENVWTGKIKVFLNGKELAKVDKTRYLIEEKKYIDFTGNSIKGLYMTVDNQTTQVTAPAKWYEIALSVLIFVVILIWGNSLTLCSIVPVVGGAIGGGLVRNACRCQSVCNARYQERCVEIACIRGHICGNFRTVCRNRNGNIGCYCLTHVFLSVRG